MPFNPPVDREKRIGPLQPELPDQLDEIGEATFTPEAAITETGDTIEANRFSDQSELVHKSDMATASAPLASNPYYAKYKSIEDVLEEDLGELYSGMDQQNQRAFKVKGEETAKAVFQIVMYESKIRARKIVDLIRRWLMIIPGINKYFLEQEVKIKTDKILALADKNKKVV
ncbi:MAG: hypothetical protein WC516_01115 [Patescibacteria group bacterium]